MGSENHEYRLSEIATFSYGKMPKAALLGTGHYPTFSGYKYQHKYPEFNCEEGEIIVVARGVGGTGDVKLVRERCYLTNLSIKINLDSEKVDKRFFFYRFLNAGLKHLDSGSAQSQITINDLRNQSVSLPGIETQKTVAMILGELDNKIELNRQMNTTLEAMAQTLFKSWFVDFDPVIDNALAAGNPIPEELADRAERRAKAAQQPSPEQPHTLPAAIRQQFPDRFVFTETMGWVPEGWEVNEIRNILHRLTVKKRYKKKDVRQFGKVPVFEQGANILLGYHSGIPEILATKKEPAFIFGDHTCVTRLSTEPFSISENVIAFQGKGFNTFWVYYAIQGRQLFEEYRRHWMELSVKYVVTPSEELATIYAESISDLVSKQADLSRQTTDLTQMRDTLLPKLLSGQLRIPEAEQLLAEAL